MHGAGFTGSERLSEIVVGVEATAGGRVRILVASTEIGQGTNTILCQIGRGRAGDRLRIGRDPRGPNTAAVVPTSTDRGVAHVHDRR